MKSECIEHEKKIAALLLGDLSEEEKQAVEAHLSTCSHCSLERESYAQAIQQLGSIGEEDVPRHFFLYQEERSVNPWQLFRQMHLRWQAALAGMIALVLLLGFAAVSRLQVKSGREGWFVSFGRSDIDIAALKLDFLQSAEDQSRKSRIAWIQEVHKEIERLNTSLTKQQQDQLTSALVLADSRMAGRISRSEVRVMDETHKTAASLYEIVAQERAQDLAAINLRLDSADARNAIKTRQTNAILSTLLQVADLNIR
jgi:hypothetical protein